MSPLCLALLLAAGAPAPPPPPAQASRQAASRPSATRSAPVVVAIVIDQLAAWVAAERLPHLPGGGFARLRREGTWVKDLAYLHAATETAPGHAALFTGRTPRENGIVANRAWRSDLGAGEEASLLEAAGEKLVGTARTARGVSLAQLTARPLADALEERFPRAVVVALSLKDRGAVFGGGHRPTAAVWYDQREGVLVTSTAFARALPAWAARRSPVLAHGAPLAWTPLDVPFLAAHAATPDDQPGESEQAGGRIFPHLVSAAPRPPAAFAATPFADSLLVDLALDALDAARRPDQPMLLTLSLSANDYVGHLYGPDSWEAWDELLRLDAELGRLMAGLDARLGPAGWAVVLSGDHGIGPLPEVVGAGRPGWCLGGAPDRYERPCLPGTRITGEGLTERLEAAAAGALGRRGPWIARVVEGLIDLTPAGRALDPSELALLEAALARAAAGVPGLATAVPMSGFAGSCPPAADESVAALACRSAAPGRGDLVLVAAPGSFQGGPGGGDNHGTPYRYDRTVPLLVRYPGGPGGRIVERGLFGSYYASAWYALTGEAVEGPYGGVVGRE